MLLGAGVLDGMKTQLRELRNRKNLDGVGSDSSGVTLEEQRVRVVTDAK